MALDVFNVRAILSGSVTGTESFDRFGSKLNTIGKNADTVNKQMNGLSRSMNALMGGLAGFSLANVIAEFARVTIQIDAYQKQLSIGFGAASTLQLEQLRKTFRTLGIAQDEALGSAVRFTSALKMSGNTAEMVNKNLEASSKIILANKLSADGANRVYYALAQVSSKGQLMTEELSGQLAENLAGIREQVAIALGLSSKALMEQMKEGKVSAEQFFTALRKIGDGIDPATLNSAAQSLGKLKNAWFDFKTSVLAVDTIKAALDFASSAIMVLTNNADFLKRSVVMLAQALSALLIFRAVAAAATFLNTAIWALQFSINLYGLKTTLAVNATLALNSATKLLGLSAGPVGWAITAAALAFGYFASGASKSEKAASALSESQQSMSNVIDMTTGKIISQDRALVEHNRLLAVAALKTNELAAAQARSQAESLFSPVTAQRSGLSVGADGSEAEKGLAEAQRQFQQSVASGAPDILGYKAAIEKLTEKYPALKSYIGDTNELFTRLIGTQRELEKSQLGVAMATGKLTEAQRTRAQALGLLFDESTGGAVKDGPKFAEAQGAIRGMQLQTALVGMSERYRFSIEKLNEAKLVSFDADGNLIVKATEYTERVRQQAFALYDAQEAQKQSNKAATEAKNLSSSISSQLQSMGASNAQLKNQIDNWSSMGDAVGKSQAALMEYETTQGKYAQASAKEKADLMAAAQLTDKYTAAIERLNEAKKMSEEITSLDKDIAKLRFKIQYFNQYGEAVDSSREAMALFDTTEGEFRNATADQKKAYLDRAREADRLTQSYNDLAAAGKSVMMRESFRESASNRVRDVQQQRIAIMGGGKKDVERAEFAQSLDKAIESARREAIRAGMANSDLQNLMADLAQDRAQAMKDFDQALSELDAAQGNWMVGAKAGLQEYFDQIQDVAGAMKNAFTRAFQGAEDALVNFVMTGKLSFSDLARSIISDLARIAIQQAIMAPLMAWMKGQSWFPAADGAAFSSGGTLQRFASGGVVSSPTAFRHSGGLGVMGEAGPEAIMPLRRLSNGRLGVESAGGGTQNVTVNVSVENGGSKMQSDGAGAKDLGKAIANVVRQELLAQKRPGGLLAA
jgi:lambda family phage tail tape measure protein